MLLVPYFWVSGKCFNSKIIWCTNGTMVLEDRQFFKLHIKTLNRLRKIVYSTNVADTNNPIKSLKRDYYNV